MHRYTQIVIIKLFTLAAFNVNVSYPSYPFPPLPPPPRYQQLIWDYKKADSKNIRKALGLVNWERLFDQKDINAQFVAFTETILNVFRNYVPNRYITVDHKDPVWMNETITSKIRIKNVLY